MDLNKVMSKVFMWMFIGLLITFGTGYYVSTNENMVYNILSTGLYYILIIIEFVVVIVLSARIKKMNPTTAKLLFAIYSFVTGLTFSSIFLIFSLSSIMQVFLITGVLFGLFAVFGYFTKIDLTKLSTFLLMALVGIIICSIINIFIGSSTFDIVISSISVFVFLMYTAYDIKKIRILENYYDNEDSLAIIGALELYLDFINIFLDLIRIFGNSRD